MRGTKARALRKQAKAAATVDTSPLLPRWFLVGTNKAGKPVRRGACFTMRYPDGHWRRIYQQLKRGGR